jgi:hypothetical protein
MTGSISIGGEFITDSAILIMITTIQSPTIR